MTTAAPTKPPGALRVRQIGAAEYDRWETLVAASPVGSIYSSPAYLDVFCGAAGGRFRVHVVESGDRWLGGVALYERRVRAGSVVGNRLLLHYNGIVAAAHESSYPSERTARELELQRALLEWLESEPAARMQLHCRPGMNDWRVFQEARWTVQPSWSYVVRIDDLDAQFKRVERNLRRLIRRCDSEGYRYDESPDFAAFFALHEQVHKRKRAPLYLPKREFNIWFSRLHEAGMVRQCNARDASGNLVASQLVLHSKHPVAHTVAAAADAQRQQGGANAWLRWQAFSALAAAGYIANDLTGAGLGSVAHFKSQLGGELQLGWSVSRPDALALRFFEGLYTLRSRLLPT